MEVGGLEDEAGVGGCLEEGEEDEGQEHFWAFCQCVSRTSGDVGLLLTGEVVDLHM